jgi:hypothetical protein
LRNGFGRIPFREAQVQSAGAVKIASAADARAESMHEPGKRRERIRDEELCSGNLSKAPAAVECAASRNGTGSARSL